MTVSRPPWWRGTRGEWYVVIQFGIFALVVFGPKNLPGWPQWPDLYTRIGTAVGEVLILAGFLLVMAGIYKLGENISALPYPKDRAVLIESGPYRFLRHPVYGGVILMAVGWAFSVQGALTFIYSVILFIFFDIKIRREEHWLRQKFPGYGDYQKRVKKLIPFIY